MIISRTVSQSTSTSACTLLLGAGRGGTTLLYKLLSLHRDVGYLSNYQARLPAWPSTARLHRLIRDRHAIKVSHWFREGGGAYMGGGAVRPLLKSLVPIPAEAESVYKTSGVPFVPRPDESPDDVASERLQSIFESVRRHAGARVLLTKRTANNRRIRWLEKAIPQARYLLLLRDGRSIAGSLLKVGWWSDHVLYWAGKTPRQLVAQGHDEVELAARNWVEEMRQISLGLAAVPPERVHVLRYEDLLENPIECLQGALSFMGTPLYDDPPLQGVISGLGLRPLRAGWGHELTAAQRETVIRIQTGELLRWGYSQ